MGAEGMRASASTRPVEGQWLEFERDYRVRRHWMVRESWAHPAKLHLGLLQWILDRYTVPGETVADCMAGIGGILLAAIQQRNVIAREIEPRWLELAHRNAAKVIRKAGLFAGAIDIGQHDAREPWGFQADHIIFSPPYANSAGSSARQKRYLPYALARAQGQYSDRWKYLAETDQPGTRGAVVFHYGEHPAQVGHLRKADYWQAMEAIYANAHNALRLPGYMVLIIKDHIYKGQRIRVADDTVSLCGDLGFQLAERHARRVFPLSLWQRRRKERGEPVVEDEAILVFKKRTP